MNLIQLMSIKPELNITQRTLALLCERLSDVKLPLFDTVNGVDTLIGYAEYVQMMNGDSIGCYVSTFDEFDNNIYPEFVETDAGYTITQLRVGENKLFPELNRKILTTEEASTILDEFELFMRDELDLDPYNGHNWDSCASDDGVIWVVEQTVGEYHGAPIYTIINLTLPIAGNHSFIITGERDSWDSMEWDYACIGLLPSSTVISTGTDAESSPIVTRRVRG